MEDGRIIALYHARAEQAIAETQAKYGGYCTAVSMNILNNRQDAEECVNDTWLWSWEHMPPDKPSCLRLYLARIVRRISITRYRWLHAARRSRSVEVALEELDECVPDPAPIADGAEPLTKQISLFLRTQSKEDRTVFLMRYFDLMPVKAIAAELGLTQNAVSKRLQAMREALHAFLTERGYTL